MITLYIKYTIFYLSSILLNRTLILCLNYIFEFKKFISMKLFESLLLFKRHEMWNCIYFSVDLFNVSTNINSNFLCLTCKFLLKEIENEIEVDFLTHSEKCFTILHLLSDFPLTKCTEFRIHSYLGVCFSLKITAIFQKRKITVINLNCH